MWDKFVMALRRPHFSARKLQMWRGHAITCSSRRRGRWTKSWSNTDGLTDQTASLPSIPIENKKGHTAPAVLTSCGVDEGHQVSYPSQSQQHEHFLPGLPEGPYLQKDSPPSSCISCGQPCAGSLRIAWKGGCLITVCTTGLAVTAWLWMNVSSAHETCYSIPHSHQWEGTACKLMHLCVNVIRAIQPISSVVWNTSQ